MNVNGQCLAPVPDGQCLAPVPRWHRSPGGVPPTATPTPRVYAPNMLLLLLACGPTSLKVPESPGADSATEQPDDSPADDSVSDDTDAPNPCAERCDDGLDCTEDLCDDLDRCVHAPLGICPWPASLPPEVIALAGLDTDFEISLSGATWNPSTRELWVVRGDGATAWRLIEDGAGSYQISDRASLGRIDAESLVLTDPAGSPSLIHVMVELEEVITAFDLSVPGQAAELRTWDTSPYLATAGSKGSEGLAFVPDEALIEWGFTDPSGSPRVSALGYGGLFFAGTQNGGQIHIFDLSSVDDSFEYIGEFDTARSDTSGLEFDAGTGRLYVWHGGEDDDLEIVRLSSADGQSLDTEVIFDYPGTPNIEGIALGGLEDCVGGVRPLFLTIDDGHERALDVYTDWPMCGD